MCAEATPDSDDCLIFHAGTRLENQQILTAGGRVLCVTGLGDNLKQAQKRAYAALAGITFDGMQYRRDIGYRALERKTSPT